MSEITKSPPESTLHGPREVKRSPEVQQPSKGQRSGFANKFGKWQAPPEVGKRA